ncbi:thioredoxin-like protein [Kalaharituber pfeilii]|nr:thioredoxin-like protein [Kalaharituber pfeilii]
MSVHGIRAISKAQNGLAGFILQCKRMEFNYCDWAGSSKGMKAFLTHDLPNFARENPSIEMVVSPRPHKHPIIRGVYINGREKVICVRNLEHQQILQKAILLKNSSGSKLKKINKPVASMNESVRGIFSPFHATKHTI